MDLEQFEFEKIEGGYALIKYTGDEENIVVPDSYDGEPVVTLGTHVFSYSKIPVNIFLPDTLKKIGAHCFERCENLKEIMIPDSVIELGSDLFLGCSSLEKVTLPKHLEILPNSCFGNCSALEFCVLPEKLKSIGVFSFRSCGNLKEIVLPTSIKEIGSQAFAHCDSLKRVVGTETDIKIHKSAFYRLEDEASQLEELPYPIWGKVDLTAGQNVVLMKSLINSYESFSETEKKDFISFLKRRKKMKEQLFLQGDSEIISFLLSLGQKFTLDELDRYLEESIKQEKTEVIALFLDYKNKNFSKTEVESHAENKELVEIGLELPTLKQFKEKWKCSKVEGGLQVTGYKVNSHGVGREGALGCKGDETAIATIPKVLACGTKIVALKHTQDGAFKGMKKLVIEAEITEIPPKAFKYTGGLEEIILPETIESIGRSAFLNCIHLKEIIIPEKVKSIGYEAFSNCVKLEKVQCHEGLAELDTIAFAHCQSLVDINLPESLKKIGEQAFIDCKSLKKITIPKKIEKIRSLTFLNCTNLEEVVVSAETIVEDGVLKGCPIGKIIRE